LQFGQPRLRRVFASEAGGPFELGGEWMKRAVLVMGRAEIPQPCMRLAREPRLERSAEA
jgi:hypothetical protein